MNKVANIIIIIILVALLVVVRAFEAQLFYDPLLAFFKSNHAITPLPEIDVAKLYVGLIFRYVLNTVISLAILWVLFKNKTLLIFSAYLFLILFILCIAIFTVLYFLNAAGPHQSLFYARRFLIQPLLLFLLVPAFYFFGNAPSLKK